MLKTCSVSAVGICLQPSLVCLQIGSHAGSERVAVALKDDNYSEDEMEKLLVDFLSHFKGPAHLGQDVGPFVIKHFGQSCRVSILDLEALSSHAT